MTSHHHIKTSYNIHIYIYVYKNTLSPCGIIIIFVESLCLENIIFHLKTFHRLFKYNNIYDVKTRTSITNSTTLITDSRCEIILFKIQLLRESKFHSLRSRWFDGWSVD